MIYNAIKRYINKKEGKGGFVKKLSMIEAQLLDQYIKCINGIKAYEHEIQDKCVEGYISSKKINGHVYHYLQWKKNGKLQSKYIKKEHLPLLEKNIEMRKEYEEIISEMKESVKKIEAFIGKKNIIDILQNDEMR